MLWGVAFANIVRGVDIDASKDGYSPARIVGKPGEKLVLVFKRTIEADCLAQVKVADGAPVELPMNTPVEVAITPEKEGKMVLQCWMAMVKATINVV